MNEKEEQKSFLKEKKSVIIFFSIIIIYFSGWMGYEYFILNTFSSEGQIAMGIHFFETSEYKCVIKEGVPNNIYTGEIEFTRGEINSPLVLLFGFDKSKLSEDDLILMKDALLTELQNLPCYEEFLNSIPLEQQTELLR